MNTEWIDSIQVIHSSALRTGDGLRHGEMRENISLKCIWIACMGLKPPGCIRVTLFPSGPVGLLGAAPGMSAGLD